MLYNYLTSFFKIFIKTNKSRPSNNYVQKGPYYCWYEQNKKIPSHSDLV